MRTSGLCRSGRKGRYTRFGFVAAPSVSAACSSKLGRDYQGRGERRPKPQFIRRSLKTLPFCSFNCSPTRKLLKLPEPKPRSTLRPPERGRWSQEDAGTGSFREGPNANPSCSMENRTMRHVDFAPLYRSTVGFDRLFSLLDTLATPDNGQTYPPYNIERTGEDAYRISMAVAGFSDDEISIEAHRNVLTVKGERAEEKKEEGNEVLLSRHCLARLRAPLPACRPRRSDGCLAEERAAAHRAQAHHSGRAEAAQDRDCQRPGQSQADRSQGGLTGDGSTGPERRLRAPLLFLSAVFCSLSRSVRRTHRHRRRLWRSW